MSDTSGSPDSQETLRGRWWLEPTPEVDVSGVLAGNGLDGYTLEIDGTLGSAPGAPSSGSWPIICGVTNEGPLTLLECRRVRSGERIAGTQWLSYELIQPTFVLKGANLGPSQLAFNRVRVSFTHLEDWWGKSGIKESASSDPVYIRYEAPASDQLRLPDDTLVTIAAGLEVHSAPRTAQLRQTAEVSFTLTTPLSVHEAIFAYIQPFRDLLTFACDHPSAITQMFLSGPAVSVSPTYGTGGYLAVMGSAISRTATPIAGPTRRLFTAASSQVPVDALIRSWYELYQAARLPLSVLLSLQYAPPAFIDTRLLLIGLALESWHRTLRDHPRKKPEVFDAKVQTILERVGKEFKSEVSSAFTYANELRLRERIEELVAIGAQSLGPLVPNGRAFARRFAQGRNDITHFTVGRARPSGAEMVELAQTGAVVMTADVLLQLGFNAVAIGPMLTATLAYTEALGARAAQHVEP